MGNKGSGKEVMTEAGINQPAQEEGVVVDGPQLVIAGVNQPKAPRRIVKATPPRKSESGDGNVSDSVAEVDKDTDDDDDDFEKVAYSAATSITSPSVARELEQEKAEIIKNSLKQSANERHRTKRETELKNRRQQKQQQALNVNSTESEQPQQQQVSSDSSWIKANPMSRFLSSFSVEQHPEHKRAFPKESKQPYSVASATSNAKSDGSDDDKTQAAGQGSDDFVPEPSGKKQKPSIPSEADSVTRDDSTSSSKEIDTSIRKGNGADDMGDGFGYSGDDEWWTNVIVIATAVIVIAAIAVRWRGKR